MGENIVYEVNDTLRRDTIKIDELMSNYASKVNEIDNNSEIRYVYQLEYDINFTVKMLSQILDYYGICKRKLKKMDMIEKIIEFEMNDENFELVDKRKKLWDYISELKNDTYLSKFILF